MDRRICRSTCWSIDGQRATDERKGSLVKFKALSGTLLASALLALAAGCGPPQNVGQSGYRIDPSSDSPAELGVRSLRSQDLTESTDQMAQDIASRLDITNPDNPPVIVVGNIENKTSQPQQNWQVFLQRLRSSLNASGAREGLEFVRERRFIEDARQEEYAGRDPEARARDYASRADYLLTATVSDLPSGGTNYFLVSFQMVQLRDAASGPDVGSGAIVWENFYEVKFH